MRKLALALIGTAISFTALSGPASAAPAGFLEICDENGGVAAVPAGTPTTAEIRWLDTRRSLVRQFSRLQTTTATINGVPVTDASRRWGPVVPSGDVWSTTWSYDVGVFAFPGDSATVSIDIALARKLRGGDGVVLGPGSVLDHPITCTIGAV
jgi:hypothetical protein